MYQQEDSSGDIAAQGMKILHVAAECYPLAKTGGLGDVVGSLAPVQRSLGLDARVMLPGYRGLAAHVGSRRELARFELHGCEVAIVEGILASPGPGRGPLPLYLVESPRLFDRAGDPYRDEHGVEHADNALRFGCFAEAAARFVLSGHVDFAPDVVHLHDWQAAPAAAWIGLASPRPATVMSIHNLAYQGLFGAEVFDELGLPERWRTPEGMESWGKCCFLKAGIRYADAVTTVSPRYAQEIRTAEFGCGLDADLRARGEALRGILNGIDGSVWDPRSDPMIAAQYGEADAAIGKAANKAAVQEKLGLRRSDEPLLVFIGRLAEQKGADLILAAAGELLRLPAQFAVLASGERWLEEGFRDVARAAPPGRFHARLAHDEALAHQLTAAADVLLMPSRYEPCGLNQMYAQRYGAIPVVRGTGGLADTVVDADAGTLRDGSATGVVFRDADAGGLLYGVRRSLELLADPSTLERMRGAGMRRDFSWDRPAAEYRDLYRALAPVAARP